MKIYSAMSAIMNEAAPIAKTRNNTTQNYSFRGIDDVYESLQAILAKHKVFTLPTVLEQIREERASRNGGLNIYSILRIKYTFYAEDGSFCEAVVVGEGMDNGDKASNKGMSVGHKYALLQAFCIPTKEPKDPENDSHDLAPQNLPKPLTVVPPGSDEPGAYVIGVGTHSGKRLDQIKDLKGWVGFHKENKKLSGPMLEAVNEAAKYLDFVERKTK